MNTILSRLVLASKLPAYKSYGRDLQLDIGKSFGTSVSLTIFFIMVSNQGTSYS